MSTTPRDIRGRTFELAVGIIKLYRHLDKNSGVPEEAFSYSMPEHLSPQVLKKLRPAKSRPDFISQKSIALKVARECHHWLKILTTSKIMREKKVTEIRVDAEEVKRVRGAIVVRTNARFRTVSAFAF